MGLFALGEAAVAVLALVLLTAGCGRFGGGDASGPETAQARAEVDSKARPEDGRGETGPSAFARPPVEPPPPPPPAPGPEAAGQCPGRADADVGVLINPRRVHHGRPAKVMFATLDGEAALAVRVEDRRGEAVPAQAVHRRGVPSSTLVTFTPDAELAPYVVTAGRDGEGLRCAKVHVAKGTPKLEPPPADTDEVWSLRRKWGPAEEALFSAWVRELFWAPTGEDLAFDQLTRVTSDPARNVLHNHLGWGEDAKSEALTLIPDCADTPYFLRAYFAWKRGLPFAFRQCSRGEDGPPSCYDLQTNLQAPDLKDEWKAWREAQAIPETVEVPSGIPGRAEMLDGPSDVSDPDEDEAGVEPEQFDALMVLDRFFRRTVAWGVHSGNGRCAYDDSRSDFYPLALTRKSLRPGTTYADPYGHLFVLVELVDQRGKQPGILYAIDGQPDGSITRKRFWEGNFLWNPDPKLGGSGFKAFRPLDRVTEPAPEGESASPRLVAASNDAIASRKGYGDVDPKVGKLSPTEFYDRMDRLISPEPLDPFLAQDAAIEALAESARVRVTSVDNGVEYVEKHPDEPIEMPWGHDVFETTGAWENYSTPARDLRLLIAMDLVSGFDEKIARNPQAYGLTTGSDLERTRAALRAERTRMLASPEYAISYERSDGTEQTLTLADLFERIERFEMAYNPNDCIEVRWGAEPDTQEMTSCHVRSPKNQYIKMKAYRKWFAKRQRPGRGDPGPPVPGLTRPGTEPQDAQGGG